MAPYFHQNRQHWISCANVDSKKIGLLSHKRCAHSTRPLAEHFTKSPAVCSNLSGILVLNMKDLQTTVFVVVAATAIGVFCASASSFMYASHEKIEHQPQVAFHFCFILFLWVFFIDNLMASLLCAVHQLIYNRGMWERIVNERNETEPNQIGKQPMKRK